MMKPGIFVFALALSLTSFAAFATDDSAKIPAPTIPLTPADAAQIKPVAPTNGIPAPVLQVQPQSTAPSSNPSAVPAPSIEIQPSSQKNSALPACETGSRIRSASCTSVVRSYGREDLDRTGQVDVGSALSRLDPSVSYNAR